MPLGHRCSWVWLRMLSQGQLQCQIVPLAMASPTMGFEEISPRGTGNGWFSLKKIDKPCFTGTVTGGNEAGLWQWPEGFAWFALCSCSSCPLHLVVGQGGNVEVQAVAPLPEIAAFLLRVHVTSTWPGVKIQCRQVCCVSKCEQAALRAVGRSQHLPLTTGFYNCCSIFTAFVILLPILANSKRHLSLPSVKKNLCGFEKKLVYHKSLQFCPLVSLLLWVKPMLSLLSCGPCRITWGAA